MTGSKLDSLPAVGAAVVNWNSTEHLRHCLSGLAAQEIPFARIVVIDNGSSDPPDELPHPCPENTDYIRLPCNVGFAKANNIAVQHLCDCKWIALVNPDAFLEPGWLSHMLDASTRHPTFFCFASRLLMADRRAMLDGLGDVYHASGLVSREGHGLQVDERAISEREVFSPCAAAALYRRDAFVAAGGFDEDFFCYVEDVDLGFRLRLAGHRCMLVPDAVALHVGSATTAGKHSDFAVYHGQRNLVWAFIKNMPGALFWMLLPFHLAINAANLVRFALRGQGKVVLRAKWDAIKGLRKMWLKRRGVQAGRVASIEDIWRAIDKRLIPDRGSGVPAEKDPPA